MLDARNSGKAIGKAGKILRHRGCGTPGARRGLRCLGIRQRARSGEQGRNGQALDPLAAFGTDQASASMSMTAGR